MEPVVLIDSYAKQEAHIITHSFAEFEDLLNSAKKINTKLFMGNWALTFIDPDTKQHQPVAPTDTLENFFARGIFTFYWNYRKPSFKHTFDNTVNEAPSKESAYTKKQHTGSKSGPVMTQIQYANMGKRILACIIDWVIVSILTGVFYTKAGSFSWLIMVLYFAVMESSSYQATFGKMVMNLKVVDTKGRKLGFMHSVGRNAGKWVSTITLFIGYFMAFFTERNQALHDIMASTIVVESVKESEIAIAHNAQNQFNTKKSYSGSTDKDDPRSVR